MRPLILLACVVLTGVFSGCSENEGVPLTSPQPRSEMQKADRDAVEEDVSAGVDVSKAAGQLLPHKTVPQDPTAPKELPPMSAPAASVPAELATPLAPAATISQPASQQTTSVPLTDARILPVQVLAVNRQFVSADELLRAAREKLIEEAKKLSSEQAFRAKGRQVLAETLWSVVGDMLIQPEADNRLPDEAKKKIETEVIDARREMIAMAGNVVALQQRLVEQGTNLEDVMADYHRHLIAVTYLRGTFYPAITISRQELWEHYCKHQADYATPKKVQMQLVAAPYRALLPEDTRNPTDAELQAAKARSRQVIDEAAAAIAAGEDISEVAKRLSREPKAASGGIWPLMGAGSFKETTVEQTAFALEKGQVSGVLETDSGYYIVKALDVTPGVVIGFEQAQVAIERQMRADRYRVLADEYYQRLLKKASIGNIDSFVESSLEVAVKRFWKK